MISIRLYCNQNFAHVYVYIYIVLLDWTLLERSWYPPACCNSCCWSHKTLLHWSLTLQLVLLEQQEALALLQTLQLVVLEPQITPGTFLDAVTGAARATGLERSWTL